jgi:branched-subunit amino acid ABC-type transport system permease component
VKVFALATIAGVGLGGLYGLIAMGYTLILASSAVFSFAQGSLAVGGSLAMYGLWQVAGWPVLGAAAAILLGGACVGVISYLISVRPVSLRRDVHDLTEATLVTTFGIGLALNSVMAIAFGSTAVPVPSYVSENPIVVRDVPINPLYIAMVSVTVVVAIVLEVVLSRTRAGLILRATVQDREGASLLGIHVTRVTFRAFGIAGALAAMAGLLIVPETSATVFLAPQFTLYGFAGMAIGGFGSFSGAIVGGIIIGLVSSISSVYINASFVSAIIYGLIVATLLVRPRGLFGTAGEFGSAKLRTV